MWGQGVRKGSVALLVTALLISGVGATAAQAATANGHQRAEPARQAELTLPMKTGDSGKYVRVLQDQLQWLGYSIPWRERTLGRLGSHTRSQVREVQKKFFRTQNGVVDERTWSTIRRAAGRVGSLPSACTRAAKTLCIDKTSKLMRYVVNGKVRQTMDVRFGVPGLDTPNGTFRVWFRWRNATSGINGPNQPRAPMPYALFFAGDVAVHYSPPFAARGYYPGGGSHGCVNVADLAGMRWLFDQIPVGTLVHVYQG
jgi:peptidoglycan hydrolase-like protein with peptidoglycan-binding domain